MNVKLSANDFETVISQRVGDSRLAELKSITAHDLPPVAYTSFDGDMWSHSELMKQYVLRNGAVPLHPEAALGTYLVTNHYKGDKGPIIDDCLSLINAVDEFYVMSTVMPEKETDIRELPEGVLAEVVYWTARRNKKIKYIDISTYADKKDYEHSPKIIDNLATAQQDGIRAATSKNRKLRKIAYLLSGESHAKHTDWMRQDAYDNELVPLSPYTLLNYGTLQIAYPNDYFMQIKCRMALAIRADVVNVYGIQPEQDFELIKLPDDTLCELYVIMRLKPETHVNYKYFGDVGVPKYTDRKKWVITEYEQGLTE